MKAGKSNDTQAIRSLLRRAGLDERETDTYLVLLSLKTATVAQVAKQTKAQRTNSYNVLRALKEKGLVSEIERGKIIHFTAEAPERLVQYAEDQKKEITQVASLLDASLPLLRQMVPSLAEQPRVSLHTGMDGMRQVYRDVLRREFVGAFNVENVQKAFGGKTVVEALFGTTIQPHGRELVADNEAGRKYVKSQDTDTLHSRLMPKHIAFESDILIFDSQIALFAYDTDYTVIRIENKNIADLLRGWFELLWETTGKRKG